MKLKVGDSQGSISLTMFASTLGGIFFTLLFANLVRYAVASYAVQQAARQAARCLSPTDPDCITNSGTASSTVSGEFRDWYALQHATPTTAWAKRYDYSLTATKQVWELGFTGYLVRVSERPPLRWTTASIPIATFRAGLNQHEYLSKSGKAHVLAEIAERHYRTSGAFLSAKTNFPDFDAIYEIGLDRAAPAAWSPRTLRDRRNSGRGYRDFAEINFLSTSAGAQNIEAGGTGEFATDFFEIPTLPADGVDVTCTDLEKRECDIRRFAGTNSPADYSWRKFAAVAIKPFASVQTVSGYPAVSWSGAPGVADKHWGLQVETIGAIDFQAYKIELAAARAAALPPPPFPTAAVELRCLGGRSAVDGFSKDEPRFVNLWLRGPKDANGGGDPNCPASQNSRFPKHDSLFVERGGAYRITGFLQASGGAAQVTVEFQTYYDSYEAFQKLLPREASCEGSYQALGSEADADCRADLLCRDRKVLAVRDCRLGELTRTPVCLTDEQALRDAHARQVPRIYCGFPRAAAICNEGDRPRDSADCRSEIAAHPERIACGWREESASRRFVEVADTSQQCSTVSRITHEAACGDQTREIVDDPMGGFGDPLACPIVRELTNRYVKNAKQLNESRSGDYTQFSEFQTPAISWSDARNLPARWAPATSLSPEVLRNVTDVSAFRQGSFVAQSILPTYEHTSPGWRPALDVFGFYGEPERAALASATLRLLSSEPISASGVYPFERQPEFEIPDALPTTEETVPACSGPAASMEIRLRAYAAAALPGIEDPAVAVTSRAVFVDSVPVAQQGGCRAEDNFSRTLPKCTNTEQHETGGKLCSSTSYLGRLPADLPSGPAQCRTSASIECYSEPVASLPTVEPQDPAIAEQLTFRAASERGFSEIRRSLTGALPSCSGPGCAEISIARRDEDHYAVHVRYDLPLSFPLDAILGTKSVPVEAEKVELRERSVSGRSALLIEERS